MNNKYFKPRRPFDFSPHPFDLGIFTGLKQGFEDNHFLSHLYEMPEEKHTAYYQHHLNHFLKKHPEKEREFFEYVWLIVANRIRYYEGKDPHSSDHAKHLHRIERLKLFQHHLQSIDQWDTGKTKDEIISIKETEIKNLKDELVAVREELKAARKLETPDYVNIAEGYLKTFLDLCLKLQEVKLTDGKELLLAQTQIVWVKMICRYFRHGNKEINYESIRRYFPADKDEPGAKAAPIPVKNRLFQIAAVKKRS